MTGENPCHERLGCPLFVNDQATGGIVRRPYPAMLMTFRFRHGVTDAEAKADILNRALTLYARPLLRGDWRELKQKCDWVSSFTRFVPPPARMASLR